MPKDTPKRKMSPIKLEDIYNQNVTTQSSIELIGADISELKSGLNAINARVHALEETVMKSSEKLFSVDLRLNALEQFNLRNCMEIKVISENEIKNVDMKMFVIDLLTKCGVKCNVNIIDKAYKKIIRTAKLPIVLVIVWFVNEDEKVRVMREKFECDKKNNLKSEIYLNHALTNYNRALHIKVLSVKSQLGMPIVFIRNGKIIMKKNKESKPTIVSSFEIIDQMLLAGNFQPNGNMEPSQTITASYQLKAARL